MIFAPGRTVVVNVSRTVIGAMRRAYANVVVVLITAPPDNPRSTSGDAGAAQ